MYELWQMLSVMFGGMAVAFGLASIQIANLRLDIRNLYELLDEARMSRDYYRKTTERLREQYEGIQEVVH